MNEIANYLFSHSYSQAGQDLFVAYMLELKRNGTWLELGCGHPKHGNNTYLLEHELDWFGVSIDLSDHSNNDITWRDRPNAKFIQCDAGLFDYTTLNDYYDYLQVDVDTATNGYNVLKRVIHTQDFAVITFEHDIWIGAENLPAQTNSRELLAEYGYELVVNNVVCPPNEGRGTHPLWFEDWYVNPKYISKKCIDMIKWVDNGSTIKYYIDILKKFTE
jgi:hypothetical protein